MGSRWGYGFSRSEKFVMSFVVAIIVVFYGSSVVLMRAGGNLVGARHVDAPTVVSSVQPKKVSPPGTVNSKKLSKKEKVYVRTVEFAINQNMPAFQEKYVLAMGHTYCVAMEAGFSKADIRRLYGKNKERPEAEGVSLLAISKRTLC